MTAVGIIPCRYASTRLPGKALADIRGRPMVWHVHSQASRARSLEAVYVASADEPILDAARALGLEVMETSGRHLTGTDCVAECLDQLDVDIYVNVQGDEPMVAPGAIDETVEALKRAARPDVVAANAFARIREPAHVLDSNVVKVTLAADGTALAYSRQPIPYPKAGHVEHMPAVYRRQLGLYAFRREGLRLFAERPPGEVERTEGIEMLRILEHGGRIAMVQVEEGALPVDTEPDLKRVRALVSAP